MKDYQEAIFNSIFALDKDLNKRELGKLEFVDTLETEEFGVLNFIFKPSLKLYLNLSNNNGLIYYNGGSLGYTDSNSNRIVLRREHITKEFKSKSSFYGKCLIDDISKEHTLLIKGNKDKETYDRRNYGHLSTYEEFIRFDLVNESYIKINGINFGLLDELNSGNYAQYFNFDSYEFIDIKDDINNSIDDLQKEIERLKELIPNLVY